MTTPLPPADPSATDDKLPGEAELAALYRQLPRREPGPELDAAVLGAAVRALHGDHAAPRIERRKAPRESGDWVHPEPLSAIAARAIPSVESAARARRRRVPHWLIGLGSAASLVLVAGLAWHMREMPSPGPDPAAAAGATRASAPTPSNHREASQAQRSGLASSPQQQVRAPMQPKSQANHLPPAALPGLKPIAPGASATAAAPYTLSGKPIGQDHAAAMDATRRAVLEKRAASAPRQPAAADKSMEVASPAPPAPAISPPGTDRSTLAHPADTPEQELAKIELLLRQDHRAEARRRLQAFRLAHPQWSLPPDLRELLGEP